MSDNEYLGRPGGLSSDEMWKPIPGYEGLYDASSLGRIRSHHRGGRVLSPGSCDDGYPIVSLYKDGRRRGYAVHTLVCLTFHGPSRPVHREVAHLDGSRTNARADNLKWCSKIENQGHKRLHGTDPAGERHPGAKLTREAVIAIRASTARYSDLAKKYGVGFDAISDVKRGRRWKSVAAGDAPKGAPHDQ